MKTDELIRNVMMRLQSAVPQESLPIIEAAMTVEFEGLEIQQACTAIALTDTENDEKMVKAFFVTKKCEGFTNRTMGTYSNGIKMLFRLCGNKGLKEITSNDIKIAIAKKELDGTWGRNSVINHIHMWSSLYDFLVDEDYVIKNPLKKIKTPGKPKTQEKALTEEQVANMRNYLMTNLREKKGKVRTTQLRNIAIFETLLSTGARVDEVENILLTDLDLANKTIFLRVCKGGKEREVYLNAASLVAIKAYLSEREENDGNEFLFAQYQNKDDKGKLLPLQKGAIECFVRDLGRKCGIQGVHPHRFRRTCATWGLNRGMPIEQVQMMLGHESIATTTIYAKSDRENLKSSHRKYLA